MTHNGFTHEEFMLPASRYQGGECALSWLMLTVRHTDDRWASTTMPVTSVLRGLEVGK